MSFDLNNIPSQKGRVAIVTGANIGLGYETTVALAQKEFMVIMACRNQQKADKARQDILMKVPTAKLEVILLDLNSLNSVRTFAKAFTAKFDHLDILINNAGIMIPPLAKTKDGFESQMGVNYFSHFLLTNLLFPLLNQTKGSRVVTLSSIAHHSGRIDFENLNAEKSYSRSGAYGQSKLACLMFAYELQRRIEKGESNVMAVSAHPGVSNTELSRHIPKFWQSLLMPLFLLMSHTPDKACQPSLMAALDSDTKGGDYYGPTGFKNMIGKPAKVTSKLHAQDEAVAKKLWEVTEELTGEKFNI